MRDTAKDALNAVVRRRQDRGKIAFLAGLAAEDQVAKQYLEQGMSLREARWRGAYGEIDLIISNESQLIFVEVKKSRDVATAAARITPKQMKRIMNAALDYLSCQGLPMETDMRFDAALVGQQGDVHVLANAFADFGFA